MSEPRIMVAVVEIPNLARGPLTAEELAALPAIGIHLRDGDRITGARKPRGGFIRQSLRGWWWHPSEEHATKAAHEVGERCFVVGDGRNVEIPARA